MDIGTFLLDIFLPRTDRIVFIQWAIMTPFWLLVLVVTFRRTPVKEYRQFAVGLAVMNLAWFCARMIH